MANITAIRSHLTYPDSAGTSDSTSAGQPSIGVLHGCPPLDQTLHRDQIHTTRQVKEVKDLHFHDTCLLRVNYYLVVLGCLKKKKEEKEEEEKEEEEEEEEEEEKAALAPSLPHALL
ncbi:hypothetical protein E2C01_022982 [Portunus trituberculatus]|uniref:Uncharacterized protein n=1 Tax=Portunus trituberculatus TaxID=210409 RepID=A0A5B7E9Z3_PORTR|nr:hypothetical protein [Portunus trituberculatus]